MGNASRPNRHKSGKNTMFQEIIAASLLYIFIVGLLYAPKCPRYEAAGNAPIDYFPDAFDIDEEKLHTESVEFMLEILDPTPKPVTEPIAVAVEPIVEPTIVFSEPITESETKKIIEFVADVLAKEHLTSAQLKAIAKRQKIKGYGSMTKIQLITAIRW